MAWPLAARAQQPSTSPPKRPIIGFLAGGSKVANERYYSGFPEGMRGFGYAEGRDRPRADAWLATPLPHVFNIGGFFDR